MLREVTTLALTNVIILRSTSAGIAPPGSRESRQMAMQVQKQQGYLPILDSLSSLFMLCVSMCMLYINTRWLITALT